MVRKLICLVSLVFVVALTGSGLAVDYAWDHGDLNNVRWDTAANWNPDGVPTNGDTASVDIDIGEPCMPVVPADINAFTDALTVSSGIFQTFNTWLTVEGRLSVSTDAFIGSWFDTGRGTLVLKPGCTFTMAGDPGRTWLGYKCRGDLFMQGGTYTLNQLELARGDDCPYYYGENPPITGTAFAYLDAGTITVNQFFTMRMGYPDCGNGGAVPWPNSNGHMDVNQGLLVIGANDKAQLDQYVADGWITAYGHPDDDINHPVDQNTWYRPGTDVNNFWMPKRATLFVDYDIRSPQRTTLSAYLPGNGEAYDPNPGYGAMGVPLAPTLTWKPGDYIKYGGPPQTKDGNGHHLFFHTNKSWVDGAALTYPIGTAFGHLYGARDANNYAPAPDFGGLLALDATYYWRIFEVNRSNPSSPWKSATWCFRTVGGRAANPSPGDGATLEYYLTEALDVNLTWNRGYFAASANGHDVYFGTVFADVNEANTVVTRGVYKGRQTPQLYSATALKLGRTYYWRIDEVNLVHPDQIWKGVTWSFTIGPYRIVEDFDYSGDAQLQAAWLANSRLDNYPCATYFSSGEVYADRGTMEFAYDNNEQWYNYDPFSEARYEFLTSADFTEGDSQQHAKALAISFTGQATNDADPNNDRMYIALEDTAGHFKMILHSDPAAQKSINQQQWNIDFREFSNAGVNLAAIKRIYIGFGVRCSWYGSRRGGRGTVWFDNLRIYIPRCLGMAGYRQPGDLGGGTGIGLGDCVVNNTDLDMMATDWLATDMLVTASNPGTNGLVVHYKFDDVSGPNVTDSSGHGFTGKAMYRQTDPCDANIIYEHPVDANWAPQGHDGNCINFAGMFNGPNEVNYAVSMPNSVFSMINNAMSISIWINAPQNHIMGTDWRPLMSSDTGINIYCPTPGPPTFTWGDDVHWTSGTPGVGYDTTLDYGSGGPADFIGWNHWVFTHDADGRTHRIYHNGRLMDDAVRKEPDFYYNPIADPNQFWICSSSGGMAQWWKGKIDDFRIYNRELTYGEVVYLAGNSQYYQALASAANIYDTEAAGSKKVNFKDLAILAQDWLETDLWPLGSTP